MKGHDRRKERKFVKSKGILSCRFDLEARLNTLPGFPFFFLPFFLRPDPSLLMAANVVEFIR